MGIVLRFLKQANKADRSYQSFKYCFESVDVPTILYDDKQKIVFSPDKNGETDKGLKTAKSLDSHAENISQHEAPLFKYYLDGSRRRNAHHFYFQVNNVFGYIYECG